MWQYLLFWLILVGVNHTEMKEPLVFDFGENKGFRRWSIINDGVMGGLSQSKAILEGKSSAK